MLPQNPSKSHSQHWTPTHHPLGSVPSSGKFHGTQAQGRSGVGNAEGTKGSGTERQRQLRGQRIKSKELPEGFLASLEGSHPLSSIFPCFHWRAGISRIFREDPSAHCHASSNSSRKAWPLGTSACSSTLSFGSLSCFYGAAPFFQSIVIIFIKQLQRSQFVPTAMPPLPVPLCLPASPAALQAAPIP